MKPTSALVLAALALAGCDEGATLVVDLRTDYVGAEEVSLAVLSVEGVATDTERALAFEDDLASGIRVAELDGLERGDHEVVLTLRAPDGRVVATRNALVDLQQATVATLLITRNCEGVACDDPALPACIDARCVPADCTLENIESCGTDACGVTSCAPPPPCADGECLDGFCISLPRSERCTQSEYCHSELGCQPRAVGADAGAPDAGPGLDAGAQLDAGPLLPDAGVLQLDAGAPGPCRGDVLEPNDTADLAADNPVAGSFGIGSMFSQPNLATCDTDDDWIGLSTVGVVRVRATVNTMLASGTSGMICGELFTWSQLRRVTMEMPTGAGQVCVAAGGTLNLGPLTGTLDGGANYVLLRIDGMGDPIDYDVSFTGSLM